MVGVAVGTGVGAGVGSGVGNKKGKSVKKGGKILGGKTVGVGAVGSKGMVGVGTVGREGPGASVGPVPEQRQMHRKNSSPSGSGRIKIQAQHNSPNCPKMGN